MSKILIQRGQSVRWHLALNQSGQPVDLTGGAWEVLEPLLKPVVTIEITDAVNGISHLNISKDQTTALPKGSRRIRARFNFPDGSAIAHPGIPYEVQ